MNSIFFLAKKKTKLLKKKEKVDGERNLTSGPSLESSMQLPVHLLWHISFQGSTTTSTL